MINGLDEILKREKGLLKYVKTPMTYFSSSITLFTLDVFRYKASKKFSYLIALLTQQNITLIYREFNIL